MNETKLSTDAKLAIGVVPLVEGFGFKLTQEYVLRNVPSI
jgi:hypothetical protein